MKNTLFAAIQDLLKQHDATSAEIEQLSTTERKLTSDAQAAQKALEQLSHADLLAAGTGRPVAKQTELNTINSQLGLIPGIRSKLQARLAELEEPLTNACRELAISSNGKVNEAMGALEIRLREFIAPIVVSEGHASNTAVSTIVRESKLWPWTNAFTTPPNLKASATSARRLLENVERFEKGEAY